MANPAGSSLPVYAVDRARLRLPPRAYGCQIYDGVRPETEADGGPRGAPSAGLGEPSPERMSMPKKTVYRR